MNIKQPVTESLRCIDKNTNSINKEERKRKYALRFNSQNINANIQKYIKCKNINQQESVVEKNTK